MQISDRGQYFGGHRGVILGYFPFSPRQLIADIGALRNSMIRAHPATFTRQEWGYLISFLAPSRLTSVYERSFGTFLDYPPDAGPDLIVVPRSPIGVWLPNNVSLMGPLVAILLSLTGASIEIKSGSRSEDLTRAFFQWLAGATDSDLLCQAMSRVKIDAFSRLSERNGDMAERCKVRVVFGSDEAAEAIEKLPHPVQSRGFYFSNRSSEIWLDGDHDVAELDDVLKVFMIYGRAGCTSPRRVVVLGNQRQAEAIAESLASGLEALRSGLSEMHRASSIILDEQLARAREWRVFPDRASGALIAAGRAGQPGPEGHFSLPVVWCEEAEALETMNSNIQTVGLATRTDDAELLKRLVKGGVSRIVPVARMHEFGPVWDSMLYWDACFDYVEVSV